MTGHEVRHELEARFGSPIVQRLEQFVDLLRAENDAQNLVARSTLDEVWSRHILDSTQLIDLAPAEGTWVDIGSGGGLPGLVIAICRATPIVLVEPRRLRAEFLVRAVSSLGLSHATVHQARAEAVKNILASVISARAVASLSRVFAMGAHLSSPKTCWLLPKGVSVEDEVADAKRSWHGTFHVERSATSPASGIVVAREVRHR